MKKRFYIKIDDYRYRCITFDFSISSSFLFDIENICVIKVYKFSNHKYSLKFFSYITKDIFVYDNLFTQKKMYDVLQNLLQNNL